jgi:hypothetical protein
MPPLETLQTDLCSPGIETATDRSYDEAPIDQLSLELVLVDADLARIARSRLPDRRGAGCPILP